MLAARVSILIFCLNILTVFANVSPSASIHTIASMQEVEKFVDAQTLVLFDLDHTVFEGKNYGYGHANWFYDQIDKGKAEGVDEKTTIQKIFLHWRVSQQNTAVKPVEDLTPPLIKKLQTDGNLVMGLTGRHVAMADITLKQLNGINVDFSSQKLPQETVEVPFSSPTVMKNGVIFCSEHDKGDVLQAYLDKLQINPKKIVFIDDGMGNLQAVIKAYSKRATVYALHYPLVAEIKKKNWDAKKAHQEYCKVYFKHPELKSHPLDCEGLV